jgi:predicted nucleic acid-binding protein
MEIKKTILYVDTSVIGGYYDEEFSSETRHLLDNLFESNFFIMFSSVTEDELLNAPKQVQQLLGKIPDELKIRVELSREAVQLADAYISAKVVGKTSREDCLHIALATIHNADVLVSWNFKHIVNIFRIKGYNSVNLSLGYKVIDIRSPKELINYEE